MTKTTRMWGVLGVVAVIVLFVWWPNDASQPAQAATTPVAAAPARARPPAPARAVAYSMSDLDRQAVAQDLRVADRIERMQKLRGKDDLVLDDLQMMAIQACSMYRGVADRNPQVLESRPELSLDAVRRDPMRAWAFDYLEQACEGLDLEQLSRDYRLLMPDWVIALRDKDEAAAIALALDDLRNSEADAALVMGLSFLERRGKSPLEGTYRDQGTADSILIVELAIQPIRCRGLDMCGSHNIIVASACLMERCPPGTTMEDYWRSKLSPKEIEAAMKLREELARYRASPVRR